MNILHLKYAYEVARLGSVSRAAELLLVAAPNISRSIKELEADLGIRIFDRSSKGMRLTSEGETSDFKDMLIYKDGYTLSDLDCRFVTELCSARRRSFGENNGYVAR